MVTIDVVDSGSAAVALQPVSVVCGHVVEQDIVISEAVVGKVLPEAGVGVTHT